MKNGRNVPPSEPGYSIAMRPGSLDEFESPGCKAWDRRKAP